MFLGILLMSWSLSKNGYTNASITFSFFEKSPKRLSNDLGFNNLFSMRERFFILRKC